MIDHNENEFGHDPLECAICVERERAWQERLRELPGSIASASRERLGSIDNPAPQHVGANAPQTSRDALATLPAQGTKRRITYEKIREAGERGLCDHEIETLTGWPHQSASAVRNALMNDGHIRASVHRRRTPSGNDAIAWIVTNPQERS